MLSTVVNYASSLVWGRSKSDILNSINSSIEELLQLDPDFRGKTGRTVLMEAIKLGVSEEAIQMLLDRGVDVHSQSSRNRWTALHYAIKYNPEIVPLLISSGVNVDAQATVKLQKSGRVEGWSPLHLAALKGRLEAARLLMKAGADVNAPNENGETPLHIAVKAGKRNLVRALLEAGANVTLENKVGFTPFELSYRGRSVETLNTFLLHGANIWQVDATNGMRPIDIAADRANKGVFSSLAMWERAPLFSEAIFYERGRDNAFLSRDNKPIEFTLLRDSKTNNLYQLETHVQIAAKAAFAALVTPLFTLGAMGQSLVEMITDVAAILYSLPSLYREEGAKGLLKKVALGIPKEIASRVWEAITMPLRAIKVVGAALYAQYDPNMGRKLMNDSWGEGNLMELTGLSPRGNLSNSLINGRTKFYLHEWK